MMQGFLWLTFLIGTFLIFELQISYSQFINCDGNLDQSFLCIVENRCIPKSLRCDGNSDCLDGTDEMFCDHVLCQGDAWFQCADGEQCITSRWLCDGQHDCDDWSDEKNCTSGSKLGAKESNGGETGGESDSSIFCKQNDFHCDGLCIPNAWKCDGNRDCLDGMDEDPKTCYPTLISSNETVSESNDTKLNNFSSSGVIKCDQFSCDETEMECIPNRWVCDGSKDCSNGADELKCGQPTLDELECNLEHGLFRCLDGSACLTARLVCDSHKDCTDGSDEGSFCYDRELLKNCTRCDQECLKTPHNTTSCYCREGFEMNEDGQCLDINECETFGKCSQTCINTLGSYSCQCKDGYRSVMNTSCMAKQDMPRLIFSTKDEIRVLNLRNHEYSLTAGNIVHKSNDGNPHAVGVSYDPLDDRVYWTDVEMDKEMIVSARINGDDKRQIVTSGLEIPEDLAVDFLARNIYFTDHGHKHIAVCQISGTYCTVLIKDGVDQPRSIALHHSKALLFYSDWGRTPQIVRAGMDGSSVTPIITDEIKWANGVTVDVTIDRIYWTDAHHDWIDSAKLDGSDRHRLVQERIKHPFSIAVFEDTVYWSDWEDQYIQACNKYNGKSHRYVVKERNLTPLGIHVSHPLIEEIKHNPCVPGHCSHLCLLSPPDGASYVCKCPLGMILSADQRTCIKDEKHTHHHESLHSSDVVMSTGEKMFILKPQRLGRELSDDLSIQGVHRISAMAYNPLNKTLYVASKGNRKIYAKNLDTRKVEVVGVGYPEDLAYDVYADNLYWTDSESNTITVKGLSNGAVRTLIEDLDKPMAIDIINHLKLLVFTEARDYPAVKIATLRGTSIEVLPGLSKLIKKPIALTVDESDQQKTFIYIADSFLGSIVVYHYEEHKAVVFNNKLSSPTSMVIRQNGHLLWTESHGNSMYWYNDKRDLKTKSLEDYLVAGGGGDGAQIRLASLDTKVPESKLKRLFAPCRYDNGGCTDLCFNGQGSETICECTEGRYLDPNNSSLCHHKCSEGLYHCGNGQCIPPRWQCDGVNECSNGHDELNCPTLTSCHNSFECKKGGECIPNQWKCDGTSDCPDNSDEENCPVIVCDVEYKMKCNDNKKCILKAWQCDGYPDCDDYSDEANCAYNIEESIKATDSSNPKKSKDIDRIEELGNDLAINAELDKDLQEVISTPVKEEYSDQNINLALGLIIPLCLILFLACFVICCVKYRRQNQKRKNGDVTLRFRNPTFGIDGSSRRKNELEDGHITNQGDQTFNAYDNPGYDTPSNERLGPAQSSTSTQFSMYQESSSDAGSRDDINRLRRAATDPSTMLASTRAGYSPLSTPGRGERRTKGKNSLKKGNSTMSVGTDSAFASIAPNSVVESEEDGEEHLSVSYTTRDKSYLLAN